MTHAIKFFLFSVICVILTGCNTTSGVGHRNSQFGDYRIKHVAVDVQPRSQFSDNVEDGVVRELNNRGVKAYKTSDLTRFTKDDEDAVRKMMARGGSELMYIILSDSSNSFVAGAHTSAYVTGNTINATTVPMVGLTRRVDARVLIYAKPSSDADPDVLVDGTAYRSAGGLAFIGDGSMASNIVKGILKTLVSSGAMPDQK